jgi:hypothetical protein
MFKKSYLFALGTIIYAIFLNAAPRFISFEYIVFIIFNFLFFYQSILNYFKNLISKTFNIEKLILLIFLFSIISIIINLSQDNLISLRQLIRDYTFLIFMFIPYLVLKLNLKLKEYKFFIFILTFSGYIIFFRLIFKNLLMNDLFIFYFSDFSYLHMDVLIIFSLNFLTLYSLVNKMYVYFFLFILQLLFSVYFMKFSGTNIYLVNFFIIISVIFVSFLLKKENNFRKIISIRYFIMLFLLLSIIIFFFKKNFLFILNNRNLEYIFLLDYYSESSFSNFLFGQSLGNSFIIKYISNEPISFLHSFISYLLLKFGILGFALIFIYLILISQINFVNLRKIHLYFILNNKNLILISSFTVLFLGFFFTTFYKTFNFWLIVGFVIKYYHLNNYKNEKIL